MNTYPKYKDSGEQWLGQIPEHWEMKRLAACFAKRSENWKRGETLELLSLLKDVGIVPYSEKGNIGNTAKTDFSQYKVARKGDLVINSMNVIIGSLGITPMDGYISPAYYAFAPREGVNTRYYNYILSLRRAQQNIRRFSKGIMEIRLKISANDFLSIQYPVPPKEEQEAMVAYLDEQTAQIDSAIAREQKMIDLLNERKQIIIQHAVTKGLNPNAKMKDSGIDWIGEIPEGWKRTSLKRVCAIKTGKTPSTTRPAYFEDGTVNWYTPGDLNEFILVDSERKVTNLAAKEQACQVYPECSVYLVGIGGTIGKVAYSEVSASCNQQINVIIPDKESLDYKFLAYYLRTAKTEIYRGANLSTLPIINQDRTGALPIICPPIEEQKAIVVFIAKAADPIDKAIAAKNRVITLLQERKQIIINEVVTGKIKVS